MARCAVELGDLSALSSGWVVRESAGRVVNGCSAAMGERRRLCDSDEGLHVTQFNNHVPQAWTC
jgi:hypothetical protein